MVKITEEKLLAFEAFSQNLNASKAITFAAFLKPQENFAAKSVCDLLEEKGGAEKLLLHFLN
ncbi:hypothetical protein [Alteromonas genovensis]|uniref:hypothetical protein n=1 Tax=Alteromonas genovensis TaxID=471225 RepID=UPI002FDF4BBB